VHIKTIGLLYEIIDDARRIGIPLDLLHHWRESEELTAIESAVQKAGFKTQRIGTPQHFINNLTEIKKSIDFIFTLSVGFLSRFRQAYGAMACELAGIPYTGADPFSKIIGQNKHIAKSFFKKLGIKTPSWVYIHDINMARASSFPKFPLIVKPACEGTSVGITLKSIVTTQEELMKQLDHVLNEVKTPAIVEQFIIGKEFKIGFIGNDKILFEGIFEDVHADGTSLKKDFLYYASKKEGMYLKEKRNIVALEFAEVRKSCNLIYHLFSPLDYGVFDIRQNKNGEFFILEFNTDATLHPDRTLSQCCRMHGVSYDEMIEKILRTAFERQGIAWN
jgi:D-alanine-D-alanine ligase